MSKKSPAPSKSPKFPFMPKKGAPSDMPDKKGGKVSKPSKKC